MKLLKTDLSIYNKFNFENRLVGVNYSVSKPQGIEQLEKSLALCEMIKEAQLRETPFYITKENEDCFGKKLLGMEGQGVSVSSGQLGVEFEIFQDARANWRLYQYQPKLKGVANYIVFAPLDKIAFEPDLLIIMAAVSQAEIIMRAMSYSTGEEWTSHITPVGACTWLFAYPYITGKVNFTVTGMSFGMKGKKVFPEGWMLISIPYNWIPTITQSLNEMKWLLPAYTLSREEFDEYEKRIVAKVNAETQQA
jgi:uncharacterized protein (DUF169 family)